MTRETIERNDIVKLQRDNKTLVGPRKKALPVDWTIEHKGGAQPVAPEAGNECHCLPMPKEGLCDQAHA